MGDAGGDRAQRIAEHAAGLPESERGAYLDAACGADEALRLRVHDLVASSGPSASEPTEIMAPGDTVVAQPGTGIGSRIDRYRIVQLLGEGGFGSVYMAEQEEPVRRRVALKIIKPGMDTRQIVARFEAERQALAMMDHPGIAKVFDAGATDRGRPYFVMELVRGVPITDYCDTQRLSAEERIALFVETCQAVQHAHQKGIIHRDIKPSNVLVTMHDGRPVPKVIDFGIAKATNQHLTEQTMFTEFGQFIGTPAYMSPEQADPSALDIDTRSDIYSLGVLLYELLTGTTPFDPAALRRAGLAEIQRIIREEDPPRPSTRVGALASRPATSTVPTPADAPTVQTAPPASAAVATGGSSLEVIARHRRTDPTHLGRALRGDLDWIVMKALDKDRTRRYDSASSFADDLRRHLSHEPVLAGPPSARYRMGKFVRRYRRGVTVAAVFALLVTGGVITIAMLWVQAERARMTADEQRGRADGRATLAIDAIDAFQAAITNNIDLKVQPELSELRDALLAPPRDFYRTLTDDLLADDTSSIRSREQLIGAQRRLANLDRLVGSEDRAVAVLGEAIETARLTLERDPANESIARDLARMYMIMGEVSTAVGERARYLELARTGFEALLEAHPDDPEPHVELGHVAYQQGLNAANAAKNDEVVSRLDFAVACYRDGLARHPENEDMVRARMIQAGISHAYLLAERMSRPRDALDLLSTFDDDVRLLGADDAGNFQALRVAPMLDRARAVALHRLGDVAEARRAADAAVTRWRALLDSYPSYYQIRSDLADALSVLGRIVVDTGELDTLVQIRAESCDIHRALVEARPTNLTHRSDLSSAMNNLAVAQYMQGRTEDALATFRSLIPIVEQTIDYNPDAVAPMELLGGLHYNVGTIASGLGRHDEAIEAFATSATIREDLVRKDPENPSARNNLAYTLGNLAGLYEDQERYELAVPAFEQARDLQRQIVSEYPAVIRFANDLARTLSGLGVSEMRLLRLDEAEAAYQESYALLDVLCATNPTVSQFQRDRARNRRSMALLLAVRGDLDAAERTMNEALAMYDSARTTFPDEVVNTSGLIGCQIEAARELIRADRCAQALPLCDRAIATLGEFADALHEQENTPMHRREAFLARAKARARLGDLDGAEADLDAVALTDPDSDVVATRNLALLAWSGHLDALIDAATHLESDPDLEPHRRFEIAGLIATATRFGAENDDRRAAGHDACLRWLRAAVDAAPEHTLSAAQRYRVATSPDFAFTRTLPEVQAWTRTPATDTP